MAKAILLLAVLAAFSAQAEDQTDRIFNYQRSMATKSAPATGISTGTYTTSPYAGGTRTTGPGFESFSTTPGIAGITNTTIRLNGVTSTATSSTDSLTGITTTVVNGGK